MVWNGESKVERRGRRTDRKMGMLRQERHSGPNRGHPGLDQSSRMAGDCDQHAADESVGLYEHPRCRTTASFLSGLVAVSLQTSGRLPASSRRGEENTCALPG
jgi:hypothetical protein